MDDLHDDRSDHRRPVAAEAVPARAALALWFPHRSGKPIPFAIPVVFVAIGVPIVWLIVASLYVHPYEGLSPSPLQLTIEHASRFVYLLIYLPIADAMINEDGRRGLAVWILPALALCVLTWVLWILYNRLGVDIGVSRVSTDATAPSKVGPLAGIVEAPGEGVGRMFFSNQIVLLPAIGVLMGLVLRGPSLDRRQRRILVAVLL